MGNPCSKLSWRNDGVSPSLMSCSIRLFITIYLFNVRQPSTEQKDRILEARKCWIEQQTVLIFVTILLIIIQFVCEDTKIKSSFCYLRICVCPESVLICVNSLLISLIVYFGGKNFGKIGRKVNPISRDKLNKVIGGEVPELISSNNYQSYTN